MTGPGRRLSSRARWALTVGLLGLMVFGPGMYHLARLCLMQWRLDRRLADLSARQDQLTQEQERLQSDPTYLEGLVRSTFKVAKPGEYVIPLDRRPARDTTR